MKAVKGFKKLLDPSKTEHTMQSILGHDHDNRFVQPPLEMDADDSDHFPPTAAAPAKSQSLNLDDRVAQLRHLVLEGYRSNKMDSNSESKSESNSDKSESKLESAKDKSGSDKSNKSASLAEQVDFTRIPKQQIRPLLSRTSSSTTSTTRQEDTHGTRGQARDPLDEEYPYLFIGPSTFSGEQSSDEHPSSHQPKPSLAIAIPPDAGFASDDPEAAAPVVNESPGAADFDIYETAYREEIERIQGRRRAESTAQPARPRTPVLVYLTHRVERSRQVVELVGRMSTAEQAQ